MIPIKVLLFNCYCFKFTESSFVAKMLNPKKSHWVTLYIEKGERKREGEMREKEGGDACSEHGPHPPIRSRH